MSPPDTFAMTLVVYGAALMIAGSILYTGTRIMSALDNLTAAVARSTTVEQSAVVAFKGIADQMKSSNDPAMQSLADELNAGADALAAAIPANTPASGAQGAPGTAQSAPGTTGATGPTGA